MSRRRSGYERKPRDFYSTPAWVTEELMKNVALPPVVLEPACGDGAISRVLTAAGVHRVVCTDIEPGPSVDAITSDFLTVGYGITDDDREIGGIVTNPPFGLADDFVELSIQRMRRGAGMVAMLLPADWDHAAKRWHLFGGCPQFARKVILTKRIRWMEGTADDKGKQPMNNHAWYIWDWRHHGPAACVYMRPQKPDQRARGRAKSSEAMKLAA